MALEIVKSDHPLYTTLLNLYERDKGTFIWYGERLFWLTWNPDVYFVELDPNTPDPRDPAGRWGKYKYLGDPDEGVS